MSNRHCPGCGELLSPRFPGEGGQPRRWCSLACKRKLLLAEYKRFRAQGLTSLAADIASRKSVKEMGLANV